MVDEYLARGDLSRVAADAVMHSFAFGEQSIPILQCDDIDIAGMK